MPALPFFTALAPAPMAPETSQSGNTKNNLLTSAPSMESPSGELTQGEAMMPGMEDTMASGDQESAMSFWQQLQMATTLTEGQESAALPLEELSTEILQEDLSDEMLNASKVLTQEQNQELATPLMSPLTMAQLASDDDSANMNMMAFSDLERQRQTQPQLQANLQQTMASQELQAKDYSLQNQFATQAQTHMTGLATDENQQTLNLATSPVQGQAMASQGLNQAALNQTGLDKTDTSVDGTELESGLDLSAMGETLDKNIHEKPITLQTKETVDKPLTSTLVMDTMQTQNAEGLDSLQGLQNQTSNRSSALEQAQQLNQAKEPSAQEKLNSQFKIDVPPQNPQWNDQVAKRIAIMASEQLQTARIQLDPPELGALEIKIRVQNDQVNVAFASNHQVVRDALENQTPRLRELLEQQGVELADVDVSSQDQQQGTSDGSGAEGDEEATGGQALVDGEMGFDEEETITTLESDSLVDYFA